MPCARSISFSFGFLRQLLSFLSVLGEGKSRVVMRLLVPVTGYRVGFWPGNGNDSSAFGIGWKCPDNSQFKKYIGMKRALIGCLIAGMMVWLPLAAQRLVPVGTGYSATSVNAAIFRNNSVVTHGDRQYVAYYDADGFVALASRALSDTVFATCRTPYRGNIHDGHNVISLMVDGDGYLHVAFDHHGHPLHYARSVAPGSLQLGKLEPMVGRDEEKVTYPEFYFLSGGDLLFLYRTGASGNGDLILNRYDVAARRWRRVQDNLIDGEGKRNGYWQACVDSRDRLHLSWVWRETWKVETNHDLCYACSDDGGETWHDSNGRACVVPLTQDNAEYACRIPQRSELINQTSMTADAAGHPYIATYWRDSVSRVPQYRLVWHDGRKWRQQQVSRRTTPFSLSGGGTKCIPIARPRLVIRQHRGFWGIGRRTEAFYILRDEERGSRVTVARCHDLGRSEWEMSDLTDFSVEAWEPSYDTELWRRDGLLHIYVQHVAQGDGEKITSLAPQPVYILEVEH